MGRLLLLTVSLLLSTSLLFGQGSYLNIMGLIRGDSMGAQFGKKVVSAGDVNGDSLPDFLVGAFYCCPTCPYLPPYCQPFGAQKVYLFYGKQGGLDTIPDLIFYHKSQLEAVGDLNGDGAGDFIMREGSQRYRLTVYFGGSILDTVPEAYLKGDSTDAFPFEGYGRFVSAGRVCDSGDIQIIVGDPGYNDQGQVYAYKVRNGNIDSVAFWKITQGDPGHFGYLAVVLGDINGDGYADIGSIAPNDYRMSIYFGRPVLDTIPDLIFRPGGDILAAVGDLNGDGFSDFIGGYSSSPSLYFGGNPLDTLPRFTLDRIGYEFVNGGDINADGYTDLLVGRNESITGYAYVYYGGPNMDRVVDLQIDEHDLRYPASGFGQTVAELGDIDGDGSNDFAVGSTSNTDPDQGYLWVFRGLLPTSVVDQGNQNIPRSFELEQNYPNPFNSSTLISYALSRRAQVRLEVFNIAGQVVKVLVDEEQSAGNHQISWEGKDSKGRPMPSGIYLYKLSIEGEVQVKKMVLVK